MDKQKDKPDTPETPASGKLPMCTCVKDPFLDLPPELRPSAKSTLSALRKVTCPGCGLVYWTNRKTDLCIDCEKKGARLPEANTNQ
ncbi:MAG: hypothetical protein MUO30_07515 [Anaerolineales bacterium]|nr:hypothetical protein [Anaerolineales bacterium]